MSDWGRVTVGEAIRAAAGRLAPFSETARLDAEVLMGHALGASRSEMLLRHMCEPAPVGFDALVARRENGEPIAYIRGWQEFFGLPLQVSPDVLIPRGDSEVLVEAALAGRPDARRVLDCGTGSGALLLAVLSRLPEAEGVGIDRADGALGIARANARALELVERARFVLADWREGGWDKPLGTFDLVLANPPYVEEGAALSRSVRDFEPAGALFAGAEGLDDYRILLPRLPGLLAPGGMAVVEIGATQAEAVGAIAADVGLEAVLHRDLAGLPRALALVARGGASGSEEEQKRASA